MVVVHELLCIAYSLVCSDGDRIRYESVLGTLHTTHFCRLLSDGHILVNHTNTTLTSNGNSHLRFGHGVHSSRYHRDIEADVTGELALEVHFARKYLRIGWYEQHIIECEAFV